MRIPEIVRKGVRNTIGAVDAIKQHVRREVLFPLMYRIYSRNGRRIILPALHYWRIGDHFDSLLLLNNSYSVMNPLCTGKAHLKGHIYDAEGRELKTFEFQIEPFGAVVQRISEIVPGYGQGVLTVTLFPPSDFFEHCKAGFDRQEPHRTTAFMGYELGRNISYVHNIEAAYIGDSLPASRLFQSVLVPSKSPRPVFMPNLSLPIDKMEYLEIISINSSSRRRHLMIRILVDGKTHAEAHTKAHPFGMLVTKFVPGPGDQDKSLRLATFLPTGNAKPYFILKYRGQQATFHHT